MGFYTYHQFVAKQQKRVALGLWQIDTQFKSKFYPTFKRAFNVMTHLWNESQLSRHGVSAW